MSELKKKAYRGLMWQICSISFGAMLSILFMMIMGRLLEPKDFGQFALVMAIIATTQTMTQFGFGPALVQKQKLRSQHTTFVFGATILLGILSCGTLWLLAPWLTQWFSGKIDSTFIRIASIGLLASTIGITSRYLLTRDLRFERLFWADNMAFLAGNLIVGSLLAFNGFGIYALIFGVVTTNVINSLMLLYFRPFSFNFNLNRTDARNLLNYGSGLLVVQLLNQFAMQADKLLIGIFSPIATLGSYERAQRIQSLPMTYIGNTLDGVAFSLLSRFSEQRARIGNQYFPLIALISILTMLISSYCFFFSSEFITLLLGAGWDESEVILKWIAVIIFIQTFSRFCDTLVRATNEFPASAKVKLAFLITIIVFGSLGHQVAGFKGIMVGIILAHLLHSLLMVRLGLQITTLAAGDFFSMFIPILIFSVVIVTKGFYLQHISPGVLMQFVLSVISDIVLLVIFLSTPRLSGQALAQFIADRASEVPWLTNSRFKFNKRV